MTTIMPTSEMARRAVKWIAEQQQEEGARPLPKLIEEASMRFNLSPVDAEFLTRFYAGNAESGQADG